MLHTVQPKVPEGGQVWVETEPELQEPVGRYAKGEKLSYPILHSKRSIL